MANINDSFNGFIVYSNYRIIDKKSLIYLYGRLVDGRTFLCINEFNHYFFIKEADVSKANSLGIKDILFTIEASVFSNFKSELVSKVILESPNDIGNLRKYFLNQSIACFEADIRFTTRFLIDNNLRGLVEISGKDRRAKPDERVDLVFENPSLVSSLELPKFKVLSMDIETDMKANRFFCISLVCDDFKKVFIISDNPVNGAVIVKDELALLTIFKEEVLRIDPDIITGWNVINFDLDFLRKKFREYKLKFDLGRNDDECTLRVSEDFMKRSSADFSGRMILDGIDLMKMSFVKLDDYTLATASHEILGEKKLISQENKGFEIEDSFKNNKQKLADYNLHDSVLVINILEKTGVLNLTIRRSILTGMSLDRVNASIASIDFVYLQELKKLKVVAYSLLYNTKEEGITGGYVMTSKPGIYDYVIVFDFKSLYPSIMRTFNIDPLAFVEEPTEKEIPSLIKSPNGAYFRKEEGILPKIIHRLWQQRDLAKKNKNELESYAIKILMNSFFGVLASPNCRFFSMKMANAITHFGQTTIKATAKEIESLGYEVIYGDTDSIFIKSKVTSLVEAQKIGDSVPIHINNFIKKYVKDNYGMPCYLDLEFDKIFVKFMMPKVRGSEVGSKKRYAGLILTDGKESIDFTGLEFVRKDWTGLSKKFQLELLNLVFHDKDVSSYTKQFVTDLLKGKYDDLLIYRRAIRKDLVEYTKTTPPHVKAARMLDNITSNVIEYVMTINGPEPMQKLKSAIDYPHYIEKQVKPIADSILCFYNVDFDSIVSGTNQKSLFDY